MKNQDKSQASIQTNFIYTPTLIVRFKSIFIDSVVVVILMYIATLILESIGTDSALLRFSAFALVVLYEPICISINRTIGQAMMGIRVKDFEALSKEGVSRNISFFKSLIRFILKVALGWISFLSMHSDTYSRTLHDKAVDSVMTLD